VLADAGISIELGGLYENERLQRRAIWKLDNDGTVCWVDSNDKYGSYPLEDFRAWPSSRYNRQ
jgi:hypothetical protein